MSQVAQSGRAIDTHAHIIDPARFPFAAGPGYKPKAHEHGTAEAYCATLDANGVAHALLVQPSGYGYDNGAMLDAMARFPGRFKAIAVVDPATSERDLRDFAEKGVVGVRFNLQSYRGDALDGPEAERFLARLEALGWFAQVFADDAKWVRVAPLLRRSGVKVLVDHFGVSDPSAGLAQPGFAAVLDLGREGRAAVKLSAPFRISRRPGEFSDLDPFVAALVGAFGIEGCVWGSDWPFLDLPDGPSYTASLGAVGRWLDTTERREAVLSANPARLFGFGR
jgi:predicted TIM-barrel fold metal-dependent hydrolase